MKIKYKEEKKLKMEKEKYDEEWETKIYNLQHNSERIVY